MIAAIFPGQGSQHVGMGKFLYEQFPTAKLTFEEASDAISVNLKKLCFEGPDSTLQLTENTQPAILTTSTALWRILQEIRPFKPEVVAGHSVGEYAALVASQSLKFAEAVRTVKIRGLAMQEATPTGIGGMIAALGLIDDQAKSLCEWVKNETKKILEPANFNAPGQIVLSGELVAIQWLKENIKNKPEYKIKLIPLSVSAPFHCSLMNPAEEKMREVLNSIQFQDAKLPVLQNYHAGIETKADLLRENLILQISSSVLWTKSIQKIHELKINHFFEIGAGKILAGLNKKILPDAKVINFNSLDEIKIYEGMNA